MATLTVEGIPPGLLRRLAGAAAANGRCVNSEAILSLVHHVRGEALRKESIHSGAVLCPLVRWHRPKAHPGHNVSWGDPG